MLASINLSTTYVVCRSMSSVYNPHSRHGQLKNALPTRPTPKHTPCTPRLKRYVYTKLQHPLAQYSLISSDHPSTPPTHRPTSPKVNHEPNSKNASHHPLQPNSLSPGLTGHSPEHQPNAQPSRLPREHRRRLLRRRRLQRKPHSSQLQPHGCIHGAGGDPVQHAVHAYVHDHVDS